MSGPERKMLALPCNALPFAWLALCASHIASPERLVVMKSMLLSWCAQSVALPLWISISYATDELRAAGTRLFAEFRAPKGVELVVLQNKTSKSQFQHYAGLVARFRAKFGSDLEAARRTWLLFTDDDDTWHPQRARVYFHRLDSLGSAARRVTEVIIERPAPDSQQHHKEHQLKQAQVQLMPEYHACAVRMAALAAFVDDSRSQLLGCSYADLFFVRFLLSPGKSRIMGNLAVDLAECIGNDESVRSAVVQKQPGLRLLLDMESSEPLYRYDGCFTSRGVALHATPDNEHARQSPWERKEAELRRAIAQRGTPITLQQSETFVRLQMTTLACLALAAYHADPSNKDPAEMTFEWLCAFEVRHRNNQQLLLGTERGDGLFIGRSAGELFILKQMFHHLMQSDPEWIAFRTAPLWPCA
jgi:hypothetical protein